MQKEIVVSRTRADMYIGRAYGFLQKMRTKGECPTYVATPMGKLGFLLSDLDRFVDEEWRKRGYPAEPERERRLRLEEWEVRLRDAYVRDHVWVYDPTVPLHDARAWRWDPPVKIVPIAAPKPESKADDFLFVGCI